MPLPTACTWLSHCRAGSSVSNVGVTYTGAPVTGSRQQAAEGKLRFLVGGEAATLRRVAPVLGILGAETVHVGAAGNGALLKLLNNFLCAVQVTSLAEKVGLPEARYE